MPPVTTRSTTRPAVARPATLAFDIGGTGLKASVLDAHGAMVHDRVRVETPYPCPPTVLLAALQALVTDLPPFDRISIAFPGVVRGGHVLTAPHLSMPTGPGGKPSKELVALWHGFDLAGEIAAALGKPTRVLNDADMQGLDVVAGTGVEIVVTLGTGVGTSLFKDGVLGPHLELAHHPFRHGESYDEQLGDVARKRIGKKKWNKRIATAIATLDALVLFDHMYLGGGNTRHITFELPPNVTIIDQNAGLLGGLRLWDDSVRKAAPRTAGAEPAPTTARKSAPRRRN